MTIYESLLAENPGARLSDVRVFADALGTYRESAANIREHGSIVQHPRTGAPIANPYAEVQARSGAILTKMKDICCDTTMVRLEKLDV